MKHDNGSVRFHFFYTEEILKTKIEVLPLSVRSFNALYRADIYTIGDIIRNWNNLRDIKNFGTKCIRETRSAIFNYNLERLNKSQLDKFVETFEYKRGWY